MSVDKQAKQEQAFLRNPRLLVERLQQTSIQVQSLRGISDVDIASPQGTLHARTAIVVQAPDLVRFEALSPLGQTIMIFTANGQFLSLYAPTEGKFFRGNTSADSLFELLRLPLDVPKVTSLLRGIVPLETPDPHSLEVHLPNDNQYLLQVFFSPAKERVQQELWIDKSTLAPQEYQEYSSSGTLKLHVLYTQFQSQDHFLFPFRQKIQFPPEQVTAEMTFLRVRLNVKLTADLFELSPPRHIPITWLSSPAARQSPEEN